MFNTYIKQLQHHIARALYIHLTVSLYSFLITVCWGLPLYPLSFCGNLLFNPILILFLGLCTLLFFTECLFIPNGYIIYLLELVTSWWLYILQVGANKSFNITFAQPPYHLLATMGLAGFVIIVHPVSHNKKSLLLSLVLCCSFWLMAQNHPEHGIETLPCNTGSLYILSTQHELIVIDPGYVGRYASAPSYIEYTLLPFLAQHYGTQTIDHLILLQPGKIIFDAVAKLLEKAVVKHIYLPLWKGEAKNRLIQSYMHMKSISQERKAVIRRIDKSEYILRKDAKANVSIDQLPDRIASSGVTYKSYCITGEIDKKPFKIYPAKYTSKLKL